MAHFDYLGSLENTHTLFKVNLNENIYFLTSKCALIE